MVEAGVSRLADLTGLDHLGIPVWQSVRPWSRALSVHQGKGWTVAEAQRGAVMEAIESHHAECWAPADTSVIRGQCWAALPADQRPAGHDDYGHQRCDSAPDALTDWAEVTPLGGSRRFVVPVAAAGLDCTAPLDTPFAMTSNGQAAHFDRDAAILSGLLELIERDACTAWLQRPPALRSATEVSRASIACPRVAEIARRLAARSIALKIYACPAVVPVTVIGVELRHYGDRRAEQAHVWGSAAARDPLEALHAALLEALQTRCTEIAGSRDTIPQSVADHAGQHQAVSLGLPAIPGWSGHRFDPAPAAGAPIDLATLVAALTRAGYGQIGYITLSPPESAAITVKAFVPGLGYQGRRRRAPL